MFPLLTHARSHGQTSISNDPLFILFGPRQQQHIQFFPVAHLRHRHHMIPPIVSVFPFHAAFFVALGWGAKVRFKSPVRSEGDEPFGLFPLVPAQDLLVAAAKVSNWSGLNTPPKYLKANS